MIAPTASEVPLDLLAHLVTVPVELAGVETRFVVDSGIGVTVVRTALADQVGMRPTGASYTGRRMSGQEVTLPLAVAPSLALGRHRAVDVEVGLLDLDGLPPALRAIGGFLSLAFFEALPFTLDHARRALVLETPGSLASRRAAGTPVPIELVRDGPALDATLLLCLPGGRELRVEIDSGSDVLILDERFAAELGVVLDGPGTRREEGVDELGQPYARTFARVPGAVHPAGAPGVVQHDPEAMFQRIVHDGLLGNDFLGRRIVTWDVPGGQLVLA